MGSIECPGEVVQAQLLFCAIDDPSSFLQTHVIGVENIMVESDYPHADCTWPHTQEKLHAQIGKLPKRAIERITWRNANDLFDVRVPKDIQKDPNAF